jgi:hypothetical protein
LKVDKFIVCPVIHAPTSKAKYIMGAMVMGLLIQTSAMAMGILQRRQIHKSKQGAI